ncbi:hypothetical protein L0Y40_01740 [Candidatus Wolfebacteria bacterium]|nr:hypothetical protein [Candidatus Wolfebacteria bacterium]
MLTLSYFAAYASGDVRLDADSVEYIWVSAENAKDHDLIKGIVEEIEMVDKILKERATSMKSKTKS